MNEGLKIGMKAPDFNFMTPWKDKNIFYNCLDNKKSFLFFLRYYGCTLCQFEISNLIESYKKFEDKGAQIFVVLQSKPETLNSQVSENDIPFTIICDPDQSLYKTYNVAPAKSKSELASPSMFKKIEKAQAKGLKHGIYEGNELQLPAVFLINEKKNIEFVHYGKDAGDIPDYDNLLSLI